MEPPLGWGRHEDAAFGAAPPHGARLGGGSGNGSMVGGSGRGSGNRAQQVAGPVGDQRNRGEPAQAGAAHFGAADRLARVRHGARASWNPGWCLLGLPYPCPPSAPALPQPVSCLTLNAGMPLSRCRDHFSFGDIAGMGRSHSAGGLLQVPGCCCGALQHPLPRAAQLPTCPSVLWYRCFASDGGGLAAAPFTAVGSQSHCGS